MIILILIFGLLLRLVDLNQSLWLDEAISTLAARDFSYYDITFNFLKIDNHPPLFYLLLKLWGEIFGFTDWILRLLPVLLGTGVVYLTYKLTLKITENKNLSKTSALLIACSPLLVYYSHEIRMYILITLLCTAQIYIYSTIIKKESAGKWALFSVLNILLFFSDYITVFLFPVFLIYPLVIKTPKLLFKTLLSFLPLALLFALWFPMLSGQLIKNRELVNIFPGWQFIVGGATVKNLAVFWMKIVLGRISFDPKLLYYSIIILGSIPLIISLSIASKQFKKYLLIWLWLVVPTLLGFLFSFLIPVFNYFRFIYVVPALIILTSTGIFLINKPIARKLLLTSLMIVSIVGLSIYYLDPSQSRENWKQAVQFIENNPSKQDLVVFEFHEPVAPYRWYSTAKVDVIGATDSYSANREKTHQKLEPKLMGKTKIYHFEYLRDLTDPQKLVEQKLAEDGFQKSEVLNDFYNIGQLSIWTK